jgi:O-succinylbenzoate synthase
LFEEPAVLIRQIELRELRMQLLHPFETSFGVTRERKIIIVKVSDGENVGYGEVTAGEGPFYSHETYQTAWHILSDFVIPRALGKTFQHPRNFGIFTEGIRGTTWRRRVWKPRAGTSTQKPPARPCGTRSGVLQKIDCGVSIGIQPSIDHLLAKIDTEVKAGYRRIKIKIKPGWDVEVIRQVRAAFPAIKLMGDANSAYTLTISRCFDRWTDTTS